MAWDSSGRGPFTVYRPVAIMPLYFRHEDLIEMMSRNAHIMQVVDPLSVLPARGVFRCVVPMRWGDMDALNHVNNVVYFRYFEEARVQLFISAGLRQPMKKQTVLVHASCDFLKPLFYPSTLVVSLVLTRAGRSSLAFDVSIECQGEPGVVHAKGKNVLVGVDPATGKALAWSRAELAALTQCFEL